MVTAFFHSLAVQNDLNHPIAAGYINAIENKQSLPSVTALFFICEYLNVTPKEFFDAETPNPTLLKELLDELRGLDDTLLTNILGIVRELSGKK